MTLPDPVDCFHLTVEEVREIHHEAIQRFGGSDGLRDRNLLESAVAAPAASYDGASVFEDVLEIAVAYLFYLCRNHPFVDGNKRTALGACLVFLQINGVDIAEPDDGWFELTLDIASSRLDRVRATQRVRTWLT